MRLVFLIAAAFTLCLPAAAQGSVDSWAGVYKTRVNIGHSDEPGLHEAENVLEIVKLNPTQAYIRVETHAYNSDRCKITGVARLEDGRLTYRGKEDTFTVISPNPNSPPTWITKAVIAHCELTLRREKNDADEDVVVLADTDGFCANGLCGLTAHLNDIRFPTTARRDIRYMERLKASREYADALEEAALSPQR